jgi:hypothetical protein
MTEKQDTPWKAAQTAAPADTTGAQLGREAITGLISLAILIVAMWAFVSTFAVGREVFTGAEAAAKKEAYERQKDLLVIAIGLLGTVTGYYLGRVPAELRAQTAQGLLNDATTATAQANQNADRVKQDARAAADAALRALQGQGPGGTAAHGRRSLDGGIEPERDQPDIEEARSQLEGLLRRL